MNSPRDEQMRLRLRKLCTTALNLMASKINNVRVPFRWTGLSNYLSLLDLVRRVPTFSEYSLVHLQKVSLQESNIHLSQRSFTKEITMPRNFGHLFGQGLLARVIVQSVSCSWDTVVRASKTLFETEQNKNTKKKKKEKALNALSHLRHIPFNVKIQVPSPTISLLQSHWSQSLGRVFLCERSSTGHQ